MAAQTMGSPLCPLFSNVYMTHIENKIFNEFNKPTIYVDMYTMMIIS